MCKKFILLWVILKFLGASYFHPLVTQEVKKIQVSEWIERAESWVPTLSMALKPLFSFSHSRAAIVRPTTKYYHMWFCWILKLNPLWRVGHLELAWVSHWGNRRAWGLSPNSSVLWMVRTFPQALCRPGQNPGEPCAADRLVVASGLEGRACLPEQITCSFGLWRLCLKWNKTKVWVRIVKVN